MTEQDWADFWQSPEWDILADLPPARTATACNALNCTCVEWVPSIIIGGYLSCYECHHSHQIHAPHKKPKAVKR